MPCSCRGEQGRIRLATYPLVVIVTVCILVYLKAFVDICRAGLQTIYKLEYETLAPTRFVKCSRCRFGAEELGPNSNVPGLRQSIYWGRCTVRGGTYIGLTVSPNWFVLHETFVSSAGAKSDMLSVADLRPVHSRTS